jgi:hypothetical protein
MNFDWIKPIINKTLEQSWGFLMPIVITLGVLLFSPGFRMWADAENFYAQYRVGLSIALVYSGSCIFYKILAWGKSFISSVLARRKQRKEDADRILEIQRVIQSLSQEERDILAQFNKRDTVVWLSIENEAVLSLQEKNILNSVGYLLTYRGRAFEQKLCRTFQINSAFKDFLTF